MNAWPDWDPNGDGGALVPFDPTMIGGSLTDDGNAQLLVNHHQTEIRYCPERGKWLHWDNHRWAWDDAGHIHELARTRIRGIDSNGQKDVYRHRERSLSHRALRAMVDLARTDVRIVTPQATLDARPLELCTPAGTVDLLSGKLRPPHPGDLHTRSTTVGPDPERDTPRWDAFLDETFGDPTIEGYVQRLAGYSITGHVGHHRLPFLHGAGANGKSVLLEVLRRVLGDYAGTSPPAFLMAGRDQHLTEIARLAGLRFVICSEVDPKARFDEAKVKMLTGGEALSARFMNRDLFEFTPTHHLWLMGNHQPQVSGGGESFWRRVRLIRFPRIVPPERRDPMLVETLVNEDGPGILAWIVEGARLALTHGLDDPPQVIADTSLYASEEDALGQFVEDRCHLAHDVAVRTETATLRKAYLDWCNDEGHTALTPQMFGRELRTRWGVVVRKSNGRKFYVGIGVLSDEDEPPTHWSDR